MDVLTDIANYTRSLGMESLILTSRMDGEAREVGRYLASIALEARFRGGVPIRRGLILSGGEPTVTVVGNGRVVELRKCAQALPYRLGVLMVFPCFP